MTTKNKSKTKERRGRKEGYSVVGEKVLQILSTAAQALDTFGDFTYNPYPYLYASLGHVHDRETINDAVSDLIEEGLVEGNRDRGLRLTPVGAGVKRGLYQARQQEWDGRWRAVFFDIPEVQRDVRNDLRFELKKLGFGLWQRSVWVTPFDIVREFSAYLQKQNLSAVVQIVVGERVGPPASELTRRRGRAGGSGDREFAAQVWPLYDLNQRYAYLLAGWAGELKKESTAEERLQAAAVFHNRYLDILASDPQLPSELLPRDWVGDDARELFKKLKSILTVGKPF